MTQQPPPFLPYSTPADEPTPACVQVISIIGICLGGLTVLGRLGGTIMGVAMTAIARNAGTPMGYSIYSLASSLLFAGFGVWLLIAAVGCLNRKELARRALVAYAVVYPIALVGDIVATALAMGPMVSTAISSTSTTRSTMPMPTTGILTVTVGIQVVFALMLMVYPTFVLIYMRSPRVRAVFS